MTPDGIANFVRQMITLILSSSAAAAYIDGTQGAAIAAGAGALVSVLWSVYSHWGMKKVPEKAVVIGK